MNIPIIQLKGIITFINHFILLVQCNVDLEMGNINITVSSIPKQEFVTKENGKTHIHFEKTLTNKTKNECKTTREGMDYLGTASETKDGYRCQNWSSQEPHHHTTGIYNDEFSDGDGGSARNYCRNPGSDEYGPWCYTINPKKRWDYCLIPMCSEPEPGTHPECKIDHRGFQY